MCEYVFCDTSSWWIGVECVNMCFVILPRGGFALSV